MAHMVRIDSGSTHGYQVRWDGGTRLFSDRVHGGKRNAQGMARIEKALQEEFAALRPPEPRALRLVMRDHGSGELYQYVDGLWTDEAGRERRFQYSIDHNGVTLAIKRALRKQLGREPEPSETRAARRRLNL